MKTWQSLLLSFLLCTLVPTSLALGDVAGEHDAFPGWLGATSDKGGISSPQVSSGIDESKIVQLSAWKPRAYLYKGFLSEAEADHIMKKATPRLKRSSVANSQTGQSELSEVRTSSGSFIGKGEDPIIKNIEKRISQWTFLPIANQEALQVLWYTKGQKYEPHFDYFSDPVNKQRGGHRYATVLMYLNDVELGGETVFPTASDPTPKDDTWSDCAKGKLAVKPHKGDAVLFFDMHPDGSPDPSSLHYACPVIKGEKWSAPMWIHMSDFTKLYKGPESNEDVGTGSEACSDTNALCSIWAAHGECNKNAVYMRSACRKSCKTC